MAESRSSTGESTGLRSPRRTWATGCGAKFTSPNRVVIVLR